MAILDFILNLAALLLWLSWRALRFDPLARTSATSLAGTLRRAEPRAIRGWQLLAGVVGLLAARSLLYSQIGPAVEWTPRLDLGAVVLAFHIRGDRLGATSLYSLLSFGRVLVCFYFWLIVLVMANRQAQDANPLDKMLRLHLGRLSRWPWPLQLALPVVLTAASWMVLHPLMLAAGAVGPVRSFLHLAEQGLVIGAALVFTLKYLLPVLLLLYLVSSYVYLGNSPVWDFVNSTARTLLHPLQRMRLQIGKVDFAPVVGAVAVLLLLEALPALILTKYPGLRGAIWPQ